MEYYINLIPEKLGKLVKDLGFKSLILSGEMGCGIKEMKEKVESAYDCRWFEWWAQGVGPWAVSCDSDEYHGMHAYAPDYAIWTEDLVDPETKEPIDIKNGAIGEFCITHLEKQACPFIRYAYGDIVQIFTEPCPNCGFPGVRVKVLGRADDMITVKGVNVYPAAVKKIVSSFIPKVTGEMRVILENPPPRIVNLKIKLEYGSGMENNLSELDKEMKREIKNNLRCNPELEWVPPNSIERPLRKPPIFEKRY
jgi:phenylacetate-CoA ligase